MHLPLLQTSLKVRLALLLGVLLVAFLASLQILRVVERNRGAQLQRESLAANEQLLRKWIDFTNQPLRRFAQDFARWDALAAFVSRPDPAWADATLRPNLANYQAHAIWILDAEGRPVYSAAANPGPALPPPSVDPPRLSESSNDSFFAESRAGLLEIWSLPITSPASGSIPRGWLLVARLWDAAHLHSLGRLSDSELLLAPADTPLTQDTSSGEIRRPLAGADDRPLRHLIMRLPSPDFGPVLALDTTAAYLFLGFGVLVVLALWLAVRRWVILPLDYIGESLARDNPACIQPLLRDRTELGRVAQLVESSFRQKAELGREIEERRLTEGALRESEARLRHALDLRARLARDLHDGVIQSIYAAGLGLEGAMSQMEKDPEGARVRLQLCRRSLNDVIREVRGFISGIEPEALHHQGFDQELAALVRTMQALWPVVIQVQANPAVVPRLTSNQELHLLQISRECISNAVRHGGARVIDIQLGEEADRAFLRVRDNGRGFDPAKTRGNGSGLSNLAARAHELGGQLEVVSRPGDGTTITVTFPLPSAGSLS